MFSVYLTLTLTLNLAADSYLYFSSGVNAAHSLDTCCVKSIKKQSMVYTNKQIITMSTNTTKTVALERKSTRRTYQTIQWQVIGYRSSSSETKPSNGYIQKQQLKVCDQCYPQIKTPTPSTPPHHHLPIASTRSSIGIFTRGNIHAVPLYSVRCHRLGRQCWFANNSSNNNNKMSISNK